MKILLTGFNSFQGVSVNPAEQVVKALANRHRKKIGDELFTAILPTEYVAATRHLRKLIRSVRPDAVVCVGVATRRESISLERVALNLDDDTTPDNAGIVRRGRQIVPTGPDVYWSTLPLDGLQKSLHRNGVKSYISNHAGTFLCNHAFYIARRETDRLRHRVPCGFIHLPGAGRGRSKRKYSLDQLIRAVECCLAVLQSTWRRERRNRGLRV